MAVAASGGVTRRAKRPRRTAKSCGPGAATLASIPLARAGAATVTRKAAHRGEHERSRKTIARGKPARSAKPVVDLLVCLFSLHARLRARSAPGFPCALSLEREEGTAKPRAPSRRGNKSAVA